MPWKLDFAVSEHSPSAVDVQKAAAEQNKTRLNNNSRGSLDLSREEKLKGTISYLLVKAANGPSSAARVARRHKESLQEGVYISSVYYQGTMKSSNRWL
jgi:hypothetical protein